MNQIIKKAQNIVCLAPKTRLQMAEEFEMIDVRQLIAAFKRHKLDIPSGNIMPKHQKMIYDALGYPTSIKKEWYADV